MATPVQPTTAPAGSPASPGLAWWQDPELWPNVDALVIEDGKPVDSTFSEKNMRLLTEPLYTSWPGPPDGQPYVVMANVGLFSSDREPPLVPDVMLSTGIRAGQDMSDKANRSYLIWKRGKVPDVVVQIVSNREGGEDTDKLVAYARHRIPFYAIFDPEDYLHSGTLRVFEMYRSHYRLMETPLFDALGLGITLWQGKYEDLEAEWLRWCDLTGRLIPTGAERAEEEHRRAEEERRRAEDLANRLERLQAQLRAQGLEPEA